ncbi:MAG TPA: LysM peptidoglycan-binding domain-containing protein, partial [Victivallales bacterium]|nr:LysM peptidoglycan-binding domain-containing protein [Victivallales bacterium]
LVFILLIFIICGCESFYDSYSRRENFIAVKAQESSNKTLEEQMARLAENIAALNASNAEIIRHINEIYQRINLLQQVDSKLQNSMNSIKQDFEQLKSTWQKANENMIEQITKEINNTIQNQSPKEKGITQQIPGGEYYVHTVEAGSTLNAIAKAYGVSIAEIKAANGMSNDLIRVGQKLYIPKK